MNPESSKEQAFDLPNPDTKHPDLMLDVDQLGNNSSMESISNIAIEQGMSGSTIPLDPASLSMPSLSAPVDPAHIALTTMPLMADDSDLIEKEWVEKAKDIVNRTKHDPYVQNKEINRVKADYLKKRYNKDIKLTEDH